MDIAPLLRVLTQAPYSLRFRRVERRGIGQRSNQSLVGGINYLVRRPEQPLYAAVWANAPRSLARAEQFFLYDGLSDSVRRTALLKVLETSQPAITDMTNYNFADPPGAVNPSAVIFAPAWGNHSTYSVGLGSLLLNTTTAPALAGASCVPAADNITSSRAISVLAFHWCVPVMNIAARLRLC